MIRKPRPAVRDSVGSADANRDFDIQHGCGLGHTSNPGEGRVFRHPNVFMSNLCRNQSGKLAGSRTVLVVDDTVYYQRILEFLLRRMNLRTLSAENGMQAVRALREQSVDLVVTDLMMPIWDGYQLCRWIRSRAAPHQRHMPVIICSSRTDRETIEQAVRVGSNDFLPKPLQSQQLEAKVRAVLQSEEGRLV